MTIWGGFGGQVKEIRGWKRGSENRNELVDFQSLKEPERSASLGLVPLFASLLVVV